LSKRKRDENAGFSGKNAEKPPDIGRDAEKNDGSLNLDAVSPDEIEKILKRAPADGETQPANAPADENKNIKKTEQSAPAEDKAQLDELRKKAAERDEFYDLLLRTRADFENFQKRTARESASAESEAIASFITDLIPVLDDFDRFIKSGAGADAQAGKTALFDGAAAIYANLWKVLSAAGLIRMDAFGKPFDVFKHEAMFAEESSKYEQPTVMEVLAEGYEFHGRILRPAKVKISKPPAKQGGGVDSPPDRETESGGKE
jgi:molecular chaperone GrpE